jgi:hypothetical protein
MRVWVEERSTAVSLRHSTSTPLRSESIIERDSRVQRHYTRARSQSSTLVRSIYNGLGSGGAELERERERLVRSSRGSGRVLMMLGQSESMPSVDSRLLFSFYMRLHFPPPPPLQSNCTVAIAAQDCHVAERRRDGEAMSSHPSSGLPL